MNVLFISHYFLPHIGGVEKHVYQISLELIEKGNNVTVITEKYNQKLFDQEIIDGIKIVRVSYPKVKILGLIFIWLSIIKNYKLILESDTVHIHDVFIWYLPSRFIFFWKRLYLTIHGFEAGDPFTINSILQKKLAVKLSNKCLGVGKYLEKYYGVKFNKIIYGGVNKYKLHKKVKNTIVFVGRLENDTGVVKFLDWLKNNKKYKPKFIGDGSFRKKCERYGKVYGFINPDKYLKTAEICIASGYLSCLEAFMCKCKIKVFWDTKLREDYWKMSPMFKFIRKGNIEDSYSFVRDLSWNNLANIYIDLWKN